MSQEKTFSIGQRLIVDHRFKSRRKFAGCDSSVWVSAMGIVGGVGEHGLLKLVGLCMTGNPSLVMPQVFQGTRDSDEEEYCQYDFVQGKDYMGEKNTTKNIGLGQKNYEGPK